jgi:hypothetical protein
VAEVDADEYSDAEWIVELEKRCFGTAAKLRYMARLNYSPKIMAYHQLMELANELDPGGGPSVPAVSGMLK